MDTGVKLAPRQNFRPYRVRKRRTHSGVCNLPGTQAKHDDSKPMSCVTWRAPSNGRERQRPIDAPPL